MIKKDINVSHNVEEIKQLNNSVTLAKIHSVELLIYSHY